MSENEKLRVDWNHGIYKCFRITGDPIDACGYSGIDILQIDIYGTYFPNGYKKISCNVRSNYLLRTYCFMTALLS